MFGLDLKKIALCLVAGLGLVGAAGSQELSTPDDGARPAAVASGENRFVTAIFLHNSHFRGSDMFDWVYPDWPAHEERLLRWASEQKINSFWTPSVCKNPPVDIVTCARRNTDPKGNMRPAYYFPYVQTMFWGDAPGLRPILKEMLLRCRTGWSTSVCNGAKEGLPIDERSLEAFPPGGKKAMMVGLRINGNSRERVTDENLKNRQLLGLAVTVCYDGPCEEEAVREEIFWNGILPAMPRYDFVVKALDQRRAAPGN